MAEQDTLALIKAALMSVEPNRAAQFEDLRLETTIDDLDLDSIALMEMIGYLEDQLDTTFPDEEMRDLGAVGLLVGVVCPEVLSTEGFSDFDLVFAEVLWVISNNCHHSIICNHIHQPPNTISKALPHHVQLIYEVEAPILELGNIVHHYSIMISSIPKSVDNIGALNVVLLGQLLHPFFSAIIKSI